MALSTMWIRDNMLYFSDQYERQLTEAELKVQRSIQKLSIPDWYLNKRSDPPKILSNVTPIESRPPSWKSPRSKQAAIIHATSTNHAGTYVGQSKESRKSINSNDLGTYKITRKPKSPESKPRRSPSKSSSKNESFDTTIPEVKLSRNISKTFPKVSPSRKIQNINIVFPPGTKLNIAETLDTDLIPRGSKYCTFVVKKQPLEDFNETVTTKHEENSWSTPTKTVYKYESSFEIPDVSFSTPNVERSFKVRAFSTPKYTPVNLFSSTIFDDTPEPKRHSQSFYETTSKIENTPVRLSQSVLETPKSEKASRSDLLLEHNIRSIEPILFETDDTPSYSHKPSRVQEIIKKIDSKSQAYVEGRPDIKTQTYLKRKTNVTTKNNCNIVEKKLEVESPSTRFFHSKKKSTELENIVQSKKGSNGKSVVQGIIEELNERSKFTLTRPSRVAVSKENFVKRIVSALEKGDTLRAKKVLVESGELTEEDDTGSSSESDIKSTVSSTSISLKDTDSSSDYDQRSPDLKSDDENRFTYDDSETRKLLEENNNVRNSEEDDSVYWIPVCRCKLPRTSSLLSMMSRMSVNPQSPCVSPIRSDSESENNQAPAWGTTFKKSNLSSRKLFRIDETAVIDSGYSDRSDRSDRSAIYSESSIVDGTWSEDTQNDSGTETRSSRLRKSSRRKTIVGRSILV